MAYRPNPNDPFTTPPPGDDYPRGSDPMMPDRLDDSSGPISGTRVALYVIAILALIGALFYGMSTTTNTDTASNPPANNMAQQPPANAPRPNTAPGTTTGTAPATPAPAPTDQPKQ